jgi:hypothetical protein
MSADCASWANDRIKEKHKAMSTLMWNRDSWHRLFADLLVKVVQ